MTGQNVVNDVSSDIRSFLGNSGNDATLILGWVNRIHKEMLRYSRWRFLLSPVQQFTTVVGQSLYYFGTNISGETPALPEGVTDTGLELTDVQFIKARSVVDYTNDKRLGETDDVPLGETWKQNGRPDLYKYDSQEYPNTLQLLPPADNVYTVQFRYYKQRQAITSLSDVLQIPDDYQDVVVAGTNYLACLFLKKADEAQVWMQLYTDGKKQMIRDANLFPREDFIRPDYVAIPHETPSIYEPFAEQF